MAATTLTLGKCYVNAGIVVTFREDAELWRQQEDVFNSLLFSQLSADKSYQRHTAPDKWYGHFKSILQEIGWILSNSRNYFDVKIPEHPTFVMPSVAVNMMEKNDSSAEEVECFRKGINALHSFPDNDPLIEHLYQSVSSSSASLILASFGVNSNEVELKMTMFVLKAPEEEAPKSLLHIYKTAEAAFSMVESSKMVLNIDIFEKIRSTISEKIGERVKSLIGELNQPEAP